MCQLFSLIQPIKALICGVVVPVIVSLTPYYWTDARQLFILYNKRNENVNREVIYASTLHYIKDTDQSKRALILALCMITVGVRETLFDVYIICREFIMLVFWTTFTLKKGGSLDIINQFLTFWPCYFFSGDRSRLGFPWLSLCRSVCAVWPFKFCAWWTWFCYNGHWSSSTAQCSFVSVKLFRAQHFFSRLFRLLFILVWPRTSHV